MSVDDYIPRGIERRECPISPSAIGSLVTDELYRNPIVGWREGVSNAWDAMRHKDKKIVKIYTNLRGDGIIEDYGHAVPDEEAVKRFLFIGKESESSTNDIDEADRIGHFRLGKNSLLALSKVGVVQFYSHSRVGNEGTGRIITLIKEPGKPVKYTVEPKDSINVLTHPGLKVVIRQVKPYTTSKLIGYLSKTFELKIARGFKIYVDDIQAKKPETFDSKQSELFRLDDGSVVYGNLTNVDKPKANNIDVLTKQVYIESQDYDYKVEGWINYDGFKLTAPRDSIRTDEKTVYPEFMEKFQDYLAEKFERRDTRHVNEGHDKKFQDIAKQAILIYSKLRPDDTLQFMQGIAAKIGLEGKLLKAGQIWKVLENSDLVKSQNPLQAGNIEVRRIRGKRKKKDRKKIRVIGRKIIGDEEREQKVPIAYDVVPGKGLVAVKKNEVEYEDEQDTIEPNIKFMTIGAGKEKPLVYFDHVQEAFVKNTSHEAIEMFNKANSDGARNEIVRAVIKAIPENKEKSAEELDKIYYAMLDSMSD
jgi:hypothetical protein